jgi:hypothetical protein
MKTFMMFMLFVIHMIAAGITFPLLAGLIFSNFIMVNLFCVAGGWIYGWYVVAPTLEYLSRS